MVLPRIKSPLTKINKNFDPAYRFQGVGARAKAREIMKKYVLGMNFRYTVSSVVGLSQSYYKSSVKFIKFFSTYP